MFLVRKKKTQKPRKLRKNNPGSLTKCLLRPIDIAEAEELLYLGFSLTAAKLFRLQRFRVSSSRCVLFFLSFFFAQVNMKLIGSVYVPI